MKPEPADGLESPVSSAPYGRLSAWPKADKVFIGAVVGAASLNSTEPDCTTKQLPIGFVITVPGRGVGVGIFVDVGTGDDGMEVTVDVATILEVATGVGVHGVAFLPFPQGRIASGALRPQANKTNTSRIGRASHAFIFDLPYHLIRLFLTPVHLLFMRCSPATIIWLIITITIKTI